jgi:Flp pilus assembly protein TadG
MRRRRGGSVIEVALFVPVVVTLLVGMTQIGKITYTYYTLRKTMYTMARYVAVQQGVNFCDDADPAIVAAKNFAVSGTSTQDGSAPVLPNLTSDMISVAAERVDAQSGTVGACDCSVTGCDAAAGGRAPDFIVVSIPNGYEVSPRIPFLTLDPIPLRPQVRVPFGGT